MKLLVEYQAGTGIKRAKEKMEDMLDGVPIEIEIENSILVTFQIELEKLNLDFAIQD